MHFKYCIDDVTDTALYNKTNLAGGVILAADYSQLELRIIAHLSKDRKLLQTLNSGADVFKNIAAQIHGTSTSKVTDIQRQQAKQVHYRNWIACKQPRPGSLIIFVFFLFLLYHIMLLKPSQVKLIDDIFL